MQSDFLLLLLVFSLSGCGLAGLNSQPSSLFPAEYFCLFVCLRVYDEHTQAGHCCAQQ